MILLAKIKGESDTFIPLYDVENEEYTVYMNSETCAEAKDGSSAYDTK